MTVAAVEAVLRRAQEDEAFRSTLRHHPDTALHGYDIEYAERQALIAGDAEKLRELGVNQELSLLAAAYHPSRQEPIQ